MTLLCEIKDCVAVLYYQAGGKILAVFGDEALDGGGCSLGKKASYLGYGNVAAADIHTNAELAAILKAHAAIVKLAADDILAAGGALADYFAVFSCVNAANLGDACGALLKYLLDLALGKPYALINRHLAVVNLLQCLAKLGCFIFIHTDGESAQRLDEMLTAGKNGVNVLFECDISALLRVVDNSRASCLGAKLKSLKDSSVILCIINLARFFKLLCPCLIVLEGIFQLII